MDHDRCVQTRTYPGRINLTPPDRRLRCDCSHRSFSPSDVHTARLTLLCSVRKSSVRPLPRRSRSRLLSSVSSTPHRLFPLITDSEQYRLQELVRIFAPLKLRCSAMLTRTPHRYNRMVLQHGLRLLLRRPCGSSWTVRLLGRANSGKQPRKEGLLRDLVLVSNPPVHAREHTYLNGVSNF